MIKSIEIDLMLWKHFNLYKTCITKRFKLKLRKKKAPIKKRSHGTDTANELKCGCCKKLAVIVDPSWRKSLRRNETKPRKTFKNPWEVPSNRAK